MKNAGIYNGYIYKLIGICILASSFDLPLGTRALIFSKHYYGVLAKQLEQIEAERYYSILYFIQNNGKCTQQFICNNLAVDKTAMVKIIEYLQKIGYISRKSNPSDRRELFISLTPKGRKRTKQISDCFRKIDAGLLGGLPKKEREIFESVLMQLTSQLQEQPSTDLFFNYKRTKK